jgi:hypothetical protein
MAVRAAQSEILPAGAITARTAASGTPRRQAPPRQSGAEHSQRGRPADDPDPCRSLVHHQAGTPKSRAFGPGSDPSASAGDGVTGPAVASIEMPERRVSRPGDLVTSSHLTSGPDYGGQGHNKRAELSADPMCAESANLRVAAVQPEPSPSRAKSALYALSLSRHRRASLPVPVAGAGPSSGRTCPALET